MELGPAATRASVRVPPSWSRFRYPQSLYKYAALLGTLAFIAYALDYLNIPLERLPGMLGRMGEMLGRRYFPPNVAHIMNAEYWHSVVETLQMSYLATVLGIALSIPLAWFASFNMTPSRRVVYPIARLIIMACRSVHEMIWTILLVAILGFGMLPGALALTLFCIGFSGKLFSEAIEAIRPGQVEAIRATGANNLQTFIYAVLPQVRVAWTGISIYTWDVVFRAATVVGFFGAGGMGWYLRESVQRVASRDVAAILLSIIVVVLISELFSAWLRTRIAKAIA
ncbi:MAG: phosphonate ABC transporter, permease protein PhnE [Casimicrobiaceae bacterium]